MTLNLEQMAIDQASGRPPREVLEIYDYDTETTTPSVRTVILIIIVNRLLRAMPHDTMRRLSGVAALYHIYERLCIG